MKKGSILYLVIEDTEKALPIFCGLKDEVKSFLGIKSDGVFFCQVSRHTRVQNKYFIENSKVREIAL